MAETVKTLIVFTICCSVSIIISTLIVRLKPKQIITSKYSFEESNGALKWFRGTKNILEVESFQRKNFKSTPECFKVNNLVKEVPTLNLNIQVSYFCSISMLPNL